MEGSNNKNEGDEEMEKNSHIKKKTKVDKADLACNKCLKIFRTKYSLSRHIQQMHEKEGLHVSFVT